MNNIKSFNKEIEKNNNADLLNEKVAERTKSGDSSEDVRVQKWLNQELWEKDPEEAPEGIKEEIMKQPIGSMASVKRKRGRPRGVKNNDLERETSMKRVLEELKEMAEFRHNIITDKIEFKPKKGRGKWKELTEKDFDTIYCHVKEQGIKTNQTDVRSAINSYYNSRKYDPVMDYLDKCKPWDESQPDYISQLFDYLEMDYQERSYAMPLLKKWFVCMVALWMGKVDTNQTMPVLKGSQNLGKSHFYRHLLPPELRDYYKELDCGQPIDKDMRLALARFLLIAFEEYNPSNKFTSNQIKAFISTNKITDRAPYERFPKGRRRKASIIASTNDDTFIKEREGSRRFLAFTIINTKYIGDDTLPYEGAYAQARWLVDNKGESAYIPTKEEACSITEHNDQYVEQTMCEIMIGRLFSKPEKDEEGKEYTMTEIIDVLRENKVPQINNSSVGNALKNMGIMKRRNSKGCIYLLKRNTILERLGQAMSEHKELTDSNIKENGCQEQTEETVEIKTKK